MSRTTIDRGVVDFDDGEEPIVVVEQTTVAKASDEQFVEDLTRKEYDDLVVLQDRLFDEGFGEKSGSPFFQKACWEEAVKRMRKKLKKER